jgi:hypothetical protein
LAAEVDVVAQLRLDAGDAGDGADQRPATWRECLPQGWSRVDVVAVGVPGLVHGVADAGGERQEREQRRDGEPNLERGRDAAPAAAGDAAQADLRGAGEEAGAA